MSKEVTFLLVLSLVWNAGFAEPVYAKCEMARLDWKAEALSLPAAAVRRHLEINHPTIYARLVMFYRIMKVSSPIPRPDASSPYQAADARSDSSFQEIWTAIQADRLEGFVDTILHASEPLTAHDWLIQTREKNMERLWLCIDILTGVLIPTPYLRMTDIHNLPQFEARYLLQKGFADFVEPRLLRGEPSERQPFELASLDIDARAQREALEIVQALQDHAADPPGSTVVVPKITIQNFPDPEGYKQLEDRIGRIVLDRLNALHEAGEFWEVEEDRPQLLGYPDIESRRRSSYFWRIVIVHQLKGKSHIFTVKAERRIRGPWGFSAWLFNRVISPKVRQAFQRWFLGVLLSGLLIHPVAEPTALASCA